MTETRAEKAQWLADGGRVEIQDVCDQFTNARVEGKCGFYFVTLYVNGDFSCTCNSGAFGFRIADFCVHALAVKLAVERSEG